MAYRQTLGHRHRRGTNIMKSILYALLGLFLIGFNSPVNAQERVVFEKFLRSVSATERIGNLEPGDYVRVEIYFEQSVVKGNFHDCITSAQIQGKTVSCGNVSFFGTGSNQIEDFSERNYVNVTYQHSCIYSPREASSGYIRVIVGRTNLRLDHVGIENGNISCTYSVGSVPWTLGNKNVGIGLYWVYEDETNREKVASQPFAYKSGLESGFGFRSAVRKLDFPISEIKRYNADGTLGPIAPYGATRIIAIIDPYGAIPETDNFDNISQPVDWFFIEQIPHISKFVGWDIGAHFQRSWFNGDAGIAQGTILERLIQAERGEIAYDYGTIKMDWILSRRNDTDGRAINAYRTLVNNFPYVLRPRDDKDAKVKEAFEKYLRRWLRSHGNRINTDIPFGNVRLQGSDLHEQQITFIEVGYSSSSARLPTLDHLQSVLGKFKFYLIPMGTVRRDQKGNLKGKITGLGIYAGDTFDFNDNPYYSQYLGDWQIFQPTVYNLPTLSLQSESIWNKNYNNYRKLTTKGRDIVILSDVKKIDISDINFSF
jgi:hypothetical protein